MKTVRFRVNPVFHGRAFGAVYKRGERRPKWSSRVSPIMDAQEGGRMLRRRLPKFSKADHLAAAKEYQLKAKRLKTEWDSVFRHAFRMLHGRAPEFHDYRISGIGDDRLPPKIKNKLRGLAHAASNYGSAAAAHWKAAGKRSRLPYFENPRVKGYGSVQFTSRGILAKSRWASRRATPTVMSRARRALARKISRKFSQPRFTLERGMSPRERRRAKGPAFPPHKRNPAPRVFVQVRKGAAWISRASAPNTPAGIATAKAYGQKLADRSGKRVRIFSGYRARKNPAARAESRREAAEAQAAARRFQAFTGHRATRARRVALPPTPKTGFAIGPVLLIGYSTIRDGKRENYVHRFAPHARPLLASSHDGRSVLMLGGAYTFTDRGIVDKRRK